jgi:hypothetical protein
LAVDGLSRPASVITQTSVVPWRSAPWVHCGGPFAAARSSTLRSISPSSPRGPAISSPSPPITSPVALTTATAATVSPAAVRIAA